MHQFNELAYKCTYFSLNVINEAYEKAVEELSETGSTPPVKQLQALNLQKMIHAVGLFSIFEAYLQQMLGCRRGFKDAEMILEQADEHALKENFHNCYLAINALKHGEGASYKSLIGKINTLNFVVESQTTPIFEEGDVSGIFALVKVDDSFIDNCLEIIDKVYKCINHHRSNFK